MKTLWSAGLLVFGLAAAAFTSMVLLDANAAPAENKMELRSVDDFADIANRRARSIALFQEAGKVITSPRCLNCHPATERPLQGDDMHPHEPPVKRGAGGMGMPGMRCLTCHGTANFDPGKVPGNPRWLLAPAEMAWVGKTLKQICVQIKDPHLNGGKTMKDLVEHMAHDQLVGWGWSPGAGRTPAPGTQEEFGKLIQAWVDTGAQCPTK
jgi:hypothetical protein